MQAYDNGACSVRLAWDAIYPEVIGESYPECIEQLEQANHPLALDFADWLILLENLD